MNPELVKSAMAPRREKPRLQSNGWPSTYSKKPRQCVASPLRNSFVPEPGSPGDAIVFPFPHTASSETISSLNTEAAVDLSFKTVIASVLRGRGKSSDRERFIEAASARERTRTGSRKSQREKGFIISRNGIEIRSKVKLSRPSVFQPLSTNTVERAPSERLTSLHCQPGYYTLTGREGSPVFAHQKSVKEALTVFNGAVSHFCDLSHYGSQATKSAAVRERSDYLWRMLRSLTTVRKRICLLDWAIGQARVHSDEELIAYRAERDELRSEVEAMQEVYNVVKSSK